MRRLSVLPLLALLALLAGCAAPREPPAGPVPASVAPAQVKPGDFWEYAVRDAYTRLPFGTFRYVVVGADAQGVIVNVLRNGLHVDTYIYGPGWNPREMPITNIQRLRFDPPLPAYAYPLAPGKSWHNVVSAFDPATGKTYRTHVDSKVVGWERVRVPAGDFDALKIRRYIYAGNAEWFTTQEEIIQYDWYAPSVRRAVREEGKSQHIDRSRSEGMGDDGLPLIVRGDWLIADLVDFSR